MAGTPFIITPPPEATPGGYDAARASTECSAGGDTRAVFRLPVTLGGPILAFTALESPPCACSLPHELCVKHAEREFQKTVHGV